MNRVHSILIRLAGLAVAVFVLFPGVTRTLAQTPAPTAPSPSTAPAPAKESDEEKNPFAPVPAPPLPSGMTGSDTNDPRYKLTPGLYDAGETAMGMKHLLLVKKPDAFQLGSNDADDPKVQKNPWPARYGNGREDAKKFAVGDRTVGLC